MKVEQLIVTDWPAGKGIDPGAAGYQIKACSAGLTAEERFRLLKIGEHYGQAVYYSAPAGARAAEEVWDRERAGRDPHPQRVLDAFPVIWSYDRISHERCALTRVCYAGWTHDGRLGNFFAHSLGFDAASVSNPMAASRSGLFRSSDAAEDTSLPVLDGLGDETAGTDYRILLKPPYRDRLEAMLSALAAASPSTRPVVIVVADWRESAPLLEALLNLLPPATRHDVTFCTYESDRNWLPPTASGARPSNVQAAHHVQILCGADNRDPGLRRDEYQKFAVFNFISGECSEVAVTAYSRFAAACVSEGKMNRLADCHGLIERFELKADSWEAAVAAVPLTSKASAQEVVRAVRALGPVVKNAQAAFDLLLPHLRALAQANDEENLAALAPEIAGLAARGADAGALRAVAAEALRDGRPRTAAALLKGFGPQRDAVGWELIAEACLGPGAFPASAEMLDFLLAGLAHAQTSSIPAPPSVITACFRSAAAAGRTAEVWTHCRSLVDPLLKGEWSPATEQFVRETESVVTPDACPDGNIALNLSLLAAVRQGSPELVAALSKIAAAAAKSRTPELHINAVVEACKVHSGGGHAFVELLAHVAENAAGPAAEMLYSEYRAAINALAGKADDVRRRLVDAGVVVLVGREMLDAAVPWEEKQWSRTWDPLLKRTPALAAAARTGLAARLNSPAALDASAPLLRRLLPDSADKPGTDPGAAALYRTVAALLPMKPLADSWNALIPHLPAALTREEKTRIGIMRFMRDAKAGSERAGWTLAEFPHTNPSWLSARDLRAPDKDEALRWCIDMLGITGIQNAHDAENAINILEPLTAREHDAMGAAIGRLLEGRDPVTRVIAATAFADLAMSAGRQPLYLTARAVAGTLDREARRLFMEHLERRFAVRVSDTRQSELYAALDWHARKPQPAAAAAAAPQGASDPGAGMLDAARGFWRKLRGGPGE